MEVCPAAAATLNFPSFAVTPIRVVSCVPHLLGETPEKEEVEEKGGGRERKWVMNGKLDQDLEMESGKKWLRGGIEWERGMEMVTDATAWICHVVNVGV